MKLVYLQIVLAVALLGSDLKSVMIPAPLIASPTIDNPRTVRVGERTVADIFVCHLQNTILVLPEKELSRNSYVADAENWVIKTTNANTASRFLSIKVDKPVTAETTVNLITDHDSSYTFRLILSDLKSPAHCDSKVFVDPDAQLTKHIEETRPWISPDEADRLRAAADQANQRAEAAKGSADTKFDTLRSTYAAKLKFDYVYDEKIAKKMGIQEVFHDTRFTYVKSASGEPPVLFERKENKASVIQFSLTADGLYSTARIIDNGYLARGGQGNGKHQEKLEFHRKIEEEK